MASVVSAAVIEGSLIIGLDDGSIIRAGYVQGPQGLTGPLGPIGATGARGTDGNTILSSQGYPRADQGKDGDFHINTRDWEIRGPKAGGSWPKAKSMLPGIEHFGKDAKTIINMGGGGGGGGGGGPAVERPPIVDGGTNTPPTVYPPQGGNPGSNLQYGDMWIDANGALHFYYNNRWNKVSVYADHVLPKDDAPYLIVTPNGEIFVNQSEYNEWLYTRTDRRPIIQSNPPTIHPDFPAYPLRDGDYWIDDNNRLYFWNGTGWAPIEGGGGRNPIFDANEPTEHPDYAPPDNVLEIGDIWYDTDNNFKQYIWDGNNWVAVSPDRFEAFTRIYEAVDPAGYNSGNDGTCALTATGSTIDTITNVKVAGTDQQSKVRYAYAAGQSIVIEDDRNGAYAVLSVTAVNGIGDYDVVLIANNGTGNLTLGQSYSFGELTDSKVEISDNPPTPALEGDLWWNSSADEMTLYVYYTSPDGTSRWTPAAPPVSLDGINTTIAVALEVQDAILERLDTGETLQATLAVKVDALEGNAGDYVEKDTVNRVTTGFRISSDNRTFISTNNNELGLYNVADPTNPAHALNLGYADGLYVRKAGDTVTGTLNVDRPSGVALNVKKDNTSNLKIHVDGTIETEQTSFSDKQLITKKYVDDEIAAIPETDLSGLATEDYVDTNINLAMVGIGVNRPPGLRFNYGNATTAVSLTNFNYYADNGNLRMRISLTSKDVKWYDGGKTKDFTYGSAQLFTIYHIPDENNYPDRWSIIRHGKFQRIDFHNDDVLVWIDEHMTNGSFVTNKNYYVTLGGLF